MYHLFRQLNTSRLSSRRGAFCPFVRSIIRETTRETRYFFPLCKLSKNVMDRLRCTLVAEGKFDASEIIQTQRHSVYTFSEGDPREILLATPTYTRAQLHAYPIPSQEQRDEFRLQYYSKGSKVSGSSFSRPYYHKLMRNNRRALFGQRSFVEVRRLKRIRWKKLGLPFALPVLEYLINDPTRSVIPVARPETLQFFFPFSYRERRNSDIETCGLFASVPRHTARFPDRI